MSMPGPPFTQVPTAQQPPDDPMTIINDNAHATTDTGLSAATSGDIDTQDTMDQDTTVALTTTTTANPTVQLHESFNFEEPNVYIRVGNTVYHVPRGPLKRSIDVFEDLFLLPLPDPGNAAPGFSVEGLSFEKPILLEGITNGEIKALFAYFFDIDCFLNPEQKPFVFYIDLMRICRHFDYEAGYDYAIKQAKYNPDVGPWPKRISIGLEFTVREWIDSGLRTFFMMGHEMTLTSAGGGGDNAWSFEQVQDRCTGSSRPVPNLRVRQRRLEVRGMRESPAMYTLSSGDLEEIEGSGNEQRANGQAFGLYQFESVLLTFSFGKMTKGCSTWFVSEVSGRAMKFHNGILGLTSNTLLSPESELDRPNKARLA
ncbi:hypothetical protein V5O48_013677 [Marasmius crinis-equi]|uniref:BTB domain-containing protein n=1 Tax=Marasmius crinis-equi TaxID=585013 RepID=A0ABR3EZF6_9AGAR